jgi:acetoin utilization deacetylase AcuC-like enzyme
VAEAAGGVLLITSDRTDAHSAAGHPERPARRMAAVEGVRDGAISGGALAEREARAATGAELQRIHPPELVAALDRAALAGGGWIDADTYLAAGSGAALRLAAGATIDAALAISRAEARVAFAVVRPPGHHAMADRPSGFCLVNNVALAAAALRAETSTRQLAIVDWDVHHGDGTQAIFDADPDLCYASTHQMPLFPGSGLRAEQGTGSAAGTKHNHPLAPGDGDDQFVTAWRDELLPAVEAFRPQAILVSAGYDAHAADLLANLEVTERGYEAVARELGALVRRLGLAGVALTLEGGYDLDAMRFSVAATVRGLLHGMAGAQTPLAEG